MHQHIPVLLNEVLTLINHAKGGYYLDATLGYAGHASAILSAREDLKLIGFDQDSYALSCSKQNLSAYTNRCTFVNANFKDAFKHLKDLNISPKDLRLVLADIGVSSVQLDYDERGFSYESSTLDMRMNQSATFDAKELVNTYSKSQLEYILINYAELAPKLASDIASKIILNRPISSGTQLSKIIGNAKLKGRNVSLKTLIFQAIRIEVNQELEVLKSFLSDCKELRNCLLIIISFHSLEDRIIKEAFKDFANDCICDPSALRCLCDRSFSLGKILTKKPLAPQAAEISANPRSSCAKLRAFYFKGD